MTTGSGRRSIVADVIPLAAPLLPQAVSDSVRETVESTFIGPGRRTAEFEAVIAEQCGVDAAVATVSGTVALGVAARALGLVPGDEILVPAYGVISVANGLASEGFVVRPVDVDPGTATINPDALDGAIGPATRAVCLVDFSGYFGPVSHLVAEVCRMHGLPVIEDAACALGSGDGRVRAGSLGDVAVTSFSVPKIVTTGQGGAVMGPSSVVDRARAWIDQGDLEWRATGINRAIGTNLRFTDIQSAIGLPQIHELDARSDRKREVHAYLREYLGPFLWTIPGPVAPLHNIVFSGDPGALVQALRSEGILAARQYLTLTRHPAYAGSSARAFPISDWWSDCAVYLPFGFALTVEDAERMVRALQMHRDMLVSAPGPQMVG